ncbi:MAG: DnaJ domain-containing protein [Deltaproteobacteria bacterium]|nr:DnaJ domain-containing protein [Deltaproteobacteria bacterium]
MTNRDPAFDDYVLKIYQVLEQLDYYRLLGVTKEDGKLQVKKAFLKITSKFHPDRNTDAPPNVKQAIYEIFKRLNEAYRVLSDPDKKRLYNEQMEAGKKRFSTDVRMSMVPKTPEDTIKSKDARQFYVQAKQSLAANNLMQADLHSKMALAREPGNQAIKDLVNMVAAAKKAR